ncbi:zinc-binding alcohol dehydrogenase family protein [Gordonia sp. CPCC 205515]|uniref:quinone oxidoreductase family protein n=1 Tax=Gordonia sp. CPCC 205515 TaxID=3140791 RepID=UPI003AF3BD41
MTTTHAAVVTEFGKSPSYAEFELPAIAEGQELVDVLAVGLHPRTRSGAAGTHYTSTGALPLIPGIDDVGRRADGRLVYFAADDDTLGTVAEQTIIDSRRCIELPDDADVVTIAAAMNPAMSSWVSLRARYELQPGARVLVLGATGNAGGMAVEIAKLLGAGEVIGAGRDPERLAALRDRGADAVVALTDDTDATARAFAEAAAEVDVVLDYLWGATTANAIVAILTARADRSRALDWIEIGSMAGQELQLPSAALRSANLRLLGSGQGSVSPRGYLAQLPSLVDEIDAGRIGVRTREVALADVERVWTEPDEPGVRTVIRVGRR